MTLLTHCTLSTFWGNNQVQSLAKGAVLDLPTEVAKDLVKAGYAQQIKAPRKNDNKKQPNRK